MSNKLEILPQKCLSLTLDIVFDTRWWRRYNLWSWLLIILYNPGAFLITRKTSYLHGDTKLERYQGTWFLACFSLTLVSLTVLSRNNFPYKIQQIPFLPWIIGNFICLTQTNHHLIHSSYWDSQKSIKLSLTLYHFKVSFHSCCSVL